MLWKQQQHIANPGKMQQNIKIITILLVVSKLSSVDFEFGLIV